MIFLLRFNIISISFRVIYDVDVLKTLCVVVCVVNPLPVLAARRTKKNALFERAKKILLHRLLIEIFLATASAAVAGIDDDCGSKLALSFSNSLSTLSDASNIRNCISTLESLFLDDEEANAPLIVFLAISTDTSAADSSASTFSSIRFPC